MLVSTQHLLLFSQGHEVYASAHSQHTHDLVKGIPAADVTSHANNWQRGRRQQPLLEDEHVEEEGGGKIAGAEHLVHWDGNVEGVSARS